MGELAKWGNDKMGTGESYIYIYMPCICLSVLQVHKQNQRRLLSLLAYSCSKFIIVSSHGNQHHLLSIQICVGLESYDLQLL